MSYVEFKKSTFEREENVVTEYFWHVKDGNHEVVAQGEGYDSLIGAENGFLNAAAAMTTAVAGFLDNIDERNVTNNEEEENTSEK